jgi:hypothetical protein
MILQCIYYTVQGGTGVHNTLALSKHYSEYPSLEHYYMFHYVCALIINVIGINWINIISLHLIICMHLDQINKLLAHHVPKICLCILTSKMCLVVT